MINLKPMSLAVTLVGLTVTTLAISPVKAATLNGMITITGTADIQRPSALNPLTDRLYFRSTQVNGKKETTQDFVSLIGSSPKIKLLSLFNRGTDQDTTDNRAVIDYAAQMVNIQPFIKFGKIDINRDKISDGILTFELDTPFNVVRTAEKFRISGLTTVTMSSTFTGVFKLKDETLAKGNGTFIVQDASRSTGNFYMTIAVPTTTGTVPEPLTILGVGTAIGFGGFFKRQISKKHKKDQK